MLLRSSFGVMSADIEPKGCRRAAGGLSADRNMGNLWWRPAKLGAYDDCHVPRRGQLAVLTGLGEGIMSVQTLLINGPPVSGKSTVAKLIADRILDRPVHYLRLQAAPDTHTNAVLAYEPRSSDAVGQGWASMHRVTYTQDRVFEIIPEGLRVVRKLDRSAFVVLEADDDPCLRHAYPYDFRIFAMRAPADVYCVFRTSEDAAGALQQVMQDTAAFASEIFGLFEDEAFDDGVGVEHFRPDAVDMTGGRQLERLHIAETQIRHFLSSPLGAEIASRIQLQPEYHALVEADVVLVNCDRRDRRDGRDALDECVARMGKLLSRVRQDARRQSVLYWGDIRSDNDGARDKLLARMRTLLAPDA